MTASVLLVAHAVLAWLLRTPAVLTEQDDAAYVLLGNALRGGAYVNLWLVGHPLQLQYPPGYPALLAVWTMFVGDSYDAQVALNVAASTAALGIVFLAFARVWTPTFAACCLAAVAFNPWVLEIAGILRPEATFALLLATALGLTTLDDRRWPLALAVGASAVAAALVRLPGLAVAAAVGLHWLLARRFRAGVLLGLATAATAGVWLAWTLTAPDQFLGSSYGADLAAPVRQNAPLVLEIAARVWNNAVVYGSQAVPWLLMLPVVPNTIIDNLVTTGLSVAGLLVGCGILFTRWRAAALFLLAYAGMLGIWTWHSGRYLYPILPLLVPAFLLGLGRISALAHRSAELAVVVGLAALMAVHGLTDTGSLLRRAAQCQRVSGIPDDTCLGPEQRGYFAALRLIADSVATGAVVLSAKPEPVHLYTGRLTVGRASMLHALEADTAATLDPLREAGVTHVLLAHLAASDRRIFRQMERRCDAVGLDATLGPDTYLFTVPARGEQPTPGACEALERYAETTFDQNTGRLRPFPDSWPPPPITRQEAVE